MTNEELDEILTSLNANMETASVMRHLRAENEKLRENNDYLRSEKERLGKDVYNLIVKKDEARAESEKLREALEGMIDLAEAANVMDEPAYNAARKVLESGE